MFPSIYLGLFLIHLHLLLSIYLSIFGCFYLSIYLCAYQSILVCFYLPSKQSRYPGLFLSIYRSLWVYSYLSIYLSIWVYSHLSIDLFSVKVEVKTTRQPRINRVSPKTIVYLLNYGWLEINKWKWFGLVLWHINQYRLFNAKSGYSYVLYTIRFVNISQQN